MYKQQIKAEVAHIFESGANEVRVLELIERLLPKWNSADGPDLPEIDEKVLGRVKLGEYEFVEIMSINSITLLGGGRRLIDWQNHDYYDPGIVEWSYIPSFSEKIPANH